LIRIQEEQENDRKMSVEETETKVDDHLQVASGHRYFLQSQLQTEEQEEGDRMSAKEKSKERDVDEL
jgi:hypothetical protein